MRCLGPRIHHIFLQASQQDTMSPHSDLWPGFSTEQVQNRTRLPLLLSLPPFQAGDNLQRDIDKCPSWPKPISLCIVPAPAKPGWSLFHTEAHILSLPGPLAKPALPWHQGRSPSTSPSNGDRLSREAEVWRQESRAAFWAGCPTGLLLLPRLAYFLLQVFTNWSIPLHTSQNFVKKGQISTELFLCS